MVYTIGPKKLITGMNVFVLIFKKNIQRHAKLQVAPKKREWLVYVQCMDNKV